jgi:undecaprenyl-diphosphatase
LAVALRRDLTALDRRTAKLVLLTSLPAAAAGLVAQDAVERRLGRPGPTAALLAGAGALLWVADRRPEHRGVGPVEAAAAGLAQVVALAPGVSRSGATLTALRARGVRRDEAVRFSMLMSLPVTAGAALLTMIRGRTAPPAGPAGLAAVTALTTAVTVNRASRRFVSAAAIYRVGLATAVAVRLRTGKEQR